MPQQKIKEERLSYYLNTKFCCEFSIPPTGDGETICGTVEEIVVNVKANRLTIRFMLDPNKTKLLVNYLMEVDDWDDDEEEDEDGGLMLETLSVIWQNKEMYTYNRGIISNRITLLIEEHFKEKINKVLKFYDLDMDYFYVWLSGQQEEM